VFEDNGITAALAHDYACVVQRERGAIGAREIDEGAVDERKRAPGGERRGTTA
jgi:hypothetical protein